MWWQYLIIFFVLLIISFVVVKLNKKNFTYEINKLVQYLGGKENIIDSGICSVCNKEQIHSFRVEKEAYGLETALIELID